MLRNSASLANGQCHASKQMGVELTLWKRGKHLYALIYNTNWKILSQAWCGAERSNKILRGCMKRRDDEKGLKNIKKKRCMSLLKFYVSTVQYRKQTAEATYLKKLLFNWSNRDLDNPCVQNPNMKWYCSFKGIGSGERVLHCVSKTQIIDVVPGHKEIQILEKLPYNDYKERN